MNSTIAATKIYENQVVFATNEDYVRQNLESIMDQLRREVDARAEVAGNTVRIICDLGMKKFEGKSLRKLLIRETKRILREVLNIHWHRNLL